MFSSKTGPVDPLKATGTSAQDNALHRTQRAKDPEKRSKDPDADPKKRGKTKKVRGTRPRPTQRNKSTGLEERALAGSGVWLEPVYGWRKSMHEEKRPVGEKRARKKGRERERRKMETQSGQRQTTRHGTKCGFSGSFCCRVRCREGDRTTTRKKKAKEEQEDRKRGTNEDSFR